MPRVMKSGPHRMRTGQTRRSDLAQRTLGFLDQQSRSDWDRNARQPVRGNRGVCAGVHDAKQAGRLFLYPSGSYMVRFMCNFGNYNVLLERRLAKVRGFISNAL